MKRDDVYDLDMTAKRYQIHSYLRDGMTPIQIAEVLGMTVAGVRSQIKKATEEFREAGNEIVEDVISQRIEMCGGMIARLIDSDPIKNEAAIRYWMDQEAKYLKVQIKDRNDMHGSEILKAVTGSDIEAKSASDLAEIYKSSVTSKQKV